MNVIVALLAISFALSAFPVLADVMPPGQITFQVQSDGKPVPDETFSAIIYSCYSQTMKKRGVEWSEHVVPKLRIEQFDKQRNCTWYENSSDVLGMYSYCTKSQCNFESYRLETFKLGIYLPSQDKAYFSDVVNNEYYSASYRVQLKPDGTATLELIHGTKETGYTPVYHPTSEKPSLFWNYLKILLPLTLLFELLATGVYLVVTKKSNWLFASVAAVNVVSVPLLVYAFTRWADAVPSKFAPVFIVGLECAVVALEAAGLKLLSRKILTWKSSFLLSLIVNVASVAGGLMIAYLFSRL